MITPDQIQAAFDTAELPQRRPAALADFETAAAAAAGPVKFIENKAVDYAYLERTMERARRANHYTNFGPVARQLEQALAHLWLVPQERSVVFTSSATTALFALAGVHASHQGRKLRFATCSFGFMATNIGPLYDTILCDSDDRGMLDLTAITDEVCDSIDGLIVTNIFGLNRDLSAYRSYCKANDKALIIDNATGFGGFDRTKGYDEVVSFHHTKAWGVGEAGIAVIAAEDEALFRALVSFGTGAAEWLRFYASNAKISDFSAGLVLDRLERMPLWTASYRAQSKRITALAADAGLRSLSVAQDDEIHAHLPFQAARPVALPSQLQGAGLPIKKYYQPLDDCGQVANSVFSHNLCLPVHTGLAALSDAIISKAVKRALS